jgi:hypothetical protein
MKEIRKCKDRTGDSIMRPDQIASEIMQLGYGLAGMDATKTNVTIDSKTNESMEFNPFYLAQFYDPTKLLKVKSYTFEYDKGLFGKVNSNSLGGIILACMYVPLMDEKPDYSMAFLVESCHLPINDEQKTKVLKWIDMFYSAYRDNVFGDIALHYSVIRCGDFNIFRDSASYSAQYSLLTSTFEDVSTDNLIEKSSHDKMYGTFYPFPHDIVQGIKIAKPTENSKSTSVTDYFLINRFSDRNIKFVSCYLDTYTYSDKENEVNTYDEKTIPVSDHIPLFCNFKLGLK